MAITSGWWMSTRLFLAQRRTPITTLASSASAIALAWFFALDPGAPIWQRFTAPALFIGAMVLAVFASITPRYFERIDIAKALLPAIHQILGLDATARLTLHHIRKRKTEKYEQITPYYPTNIGQGRRFAFTQGITGQAFRTRQSQAYSIPDERQLSDDYKIRWAFTADEIGRLTQDRRSFYAFPIGQEGSFARAVLYCDSADASTFDPLRKDELDKKIETLFLPTLERLLEASDRSIS